MLDIFFQEYRNTVFLNSKEIDHMSEGRSGMDKTNRGKDERKEDDKKSLALDNDKKWINKEINDGE